MTTMAETRERSAAAARAGAPADAAGGAGAVGLRQVEAIVLPDGTLRRPEAAKFLGVRPATLSRWAVHGTWGLLPRRDRGH